MRRAIPCLPGGGPACLVNIKAPTGVLRKMTHKVSFFSYMCPDEGKHRKRMCAGRKGLGLFGRGCRGSVHPVRRNYRYPTYQRCDETCVQRLLGTGRVLNVHLYILRGLCFCGAVVRRVQSTLSTKGFTSCGRRGLCQVKRSDVGGIWGDRGNLPGRQGLYEVNFDV